MNFTVNDWKRLAFINVEAQIMALLDLIELERDDGPDLSGAIKAHEEGWETNAWCLARVADALRAAAPLIKSQMGLLAVEQQALVERLPITGYEELAFRTHVDRNCGLQE